MASILSKSRRSPESLPHGWATSSPPRGMETNRAGGEAVSRRWRSQKQIPAVCAQAVCLSVLFRHGTPRAAPAAQCHVRTQRGRPRLGTQRSPVTLASLSVSAILFPDGQIKGVQQHPEHHSGSATNSGKSRPSPRREDSPRDARHPQECRSQAVCSYFQMRAHL